MTARTHDAFAFASLVTVTTYYPPSYLNLFTLFSALVGNVIGGLAPDIDQASNRLWDLLPAGNFIGRLLRPIFLGHRTLSHSIVGLYLYYKLLELLLPKILNPGFVDINIVLWAMMIGFISHLLTDSLTEEGVPLLFPLKFKFGFPPISSWRIKTGGWFENLVILPGVAIYLVWFVINHKERLVKIVELVRG